jgi:hypothetical protein
MLSPNLLTVVEEIDAIKEARPDLTQPKGGGVLLANAVHADGAPQRDTQGLPTIVVLAALGVVYGDVGTSTLYRLKQAVGGPAPETMTASSR